MISRLVITLKNKSNIKLNQNGSSLMQGVLMEKISYAYGETLHISNLKPYSQYILTKGEDIVWVIQAVNEQAKIEIVDKFREQKETTLYIKHKKLELNIVDKQYVEYSYTELINQTFFGNTSKKIMVEFMSPTGFKSNGEYVFYPSVRKIFQSLMKKFDFCSNENTIMSHDLLDEIEENVKIIDYRIRSTRFHMEGIYIPSYMGTVTFLVKGPQQLANVVNMLLKFGEFSGVGIKTAMGMGAMKIIERRG